MKGSVNLYKVKTKVKGSALIVVIIIIAVLSIVLLGTISSVLASLNQSTAIYQKSTTGYAAESGAEEFLYYFNLLLEDAKDIAYDYYYDENGNLKNTTNSRVTSLLGSDFEPGNIKSALQRGIIIIDVAKDRVIEGMRALIKDEVYKFVSNIGSNASVYIQTAQMSINKLDDLEKVIEQQFMANSDYKIESIRVEPWTTPNPDGYTVYISTFKEKQNMVGVKETTKKLRIDFEIGRIDRNSIEVNTTSSTSTVSTSPLDYAIFSKGALMTNKNLTIQGGSVYSGGSTTIDGGADFDIINLIVKGELIINQDDNPLCRNNNLNINNILFVANAFKTNTSDTRMTNISAKTAYFGGTVDLNGRGNYNFEQIFAERAFTMSGGNVDLSLKGVGYFKDTLAVQNDAVFKLERGAKLYCNRLSVRNGSAKIILDQGAELYIATSLDLNTRNRIQINGGSYIENYNFSYPPLPNDIELIKNTDFSEGITMEPLPNDPVGSEDLGSTADTSVSPPQIVIYGESQINQNQAEDEIRARLNLSSIDFSTLSMFLISRGNITFSGSGLTNLNGAIISLGSTFNINTGSNPYAGLKLVYNNPSSAIEQNIESSTGIKPSQLIFTEDNAQLSNVLYRIRRRTFISK